MTGTSNTAANAGPAVVRAPVRPPDRWRYGVAALAVGAAVLLKLISTPWIDRESPFLLFSAAVMVSAWRGGAGPGLLATVLAALASDYLFLEPTGTLFAYGQGQGVRITQFVLEGVVISLLGGALHRARQRAEAFARGERSARQEAETARAELARMYDKEHRIAETLQRSLLLQAAVGPLGALDIAWFYEAAWDEAQIGGDFYDAFALPGGQVALVVGDVSGKGLGAAARTAEVKFALRALLHEDAAPERALARVNRYLCGPSRGAGLPGDEDVCNRFIAVSLAVIEPDGGETRLAVAGAEPPLVLPADASAGGAHAVEGPHGPPLGIQANVEYPSACFVLARGDTLLLFTDGITEARAPGADGGFLDYTGLIALAQKAAPRGVPEPVAAIGGRLLDGVKRFAGGSLRDDACILLARRR